MKQHERRESIGLSVSADATRNLKKFWIKFPETKKLYDYDLWTHEFITMRGEDIGECPKPEYATKYFGELPLLSDPGKETSSGYDLTYFVIRGIERIYHAPDIVCYVFYRSGPSTLDLFLANSVLRDSDNIESLIPNKYAWSELRLFLDIGIKTNSIIADYVVNHADRYFIHDIAEAVQLHFLGRTRWWVNIKSMLNQFKSML